MLKMIQPSRKVLALTVELDSTHKPMNWDVNYLMKVQFYKETDGWSLYHPSIHCIIIHPVTTPSSTALTFYFIYFYPSGPDFYVATFPYKWSLHPLFSFHFLHLPFSEFSCSFLSYQFLQFHFKIFKSSMSFFQLLTTSGGLNDMPKTPQQFLKILDQDVRQRNSPGLRLLFDTILRTTNRNVLEEIFEKKTNGHNLLTYVLCNTRCERSRNKAVDVLNYLYFHGLVWSNGLRYYSLVY